jgi:SH3-like domain-containing protein
VGRIELCRIDRRINCSAGFLILIASLLFAFSAHAAEYASIAKDGVNLRSGPSTGKEILWEVFKGFPVKILVRQGDWAQVSDFEGDKGWIYSPLLSSDKTVIVKVDSANMRSGPGTNYEVVAKVKYGVVFASSERRGEWVKVTHDDGTSGWLHTSLIWP